MSSYPRTLAIVLSVGVLFGCNKPDESADSAKSSEISTDEQKFGYTLGVNIGGSLKPVSKYVDYAQLKQGIDDVIGDAELAMTEEERNQIQQIMSEKIQADQHAERDQAAAKAKEDGEKFLAENAKRDGVTTTESGLQYEVLTAGNEDGKSPTAEDEVTVHYQGTLADGTVFDSSYERGQPVTFPLGEVIPGWTEGVQLMKEGAKFKFVLPPDLGYGETGAGVRIPPNSVLIFEVELISVGAPPAASE